MDTRKTSGNFGNWKRSRWDTKSWCTSLDIGATPAPWHEIPGFYWRGGLSAIQRRFSYTQLDWHSILSRLCVIGTFIAFNRLP